jgi:hypothetical protein
MRSAAAILRRRRTGTPTRAAGSQRLNFPPQFSQGIRTMNDSFQKHSQSWVSFSYISFGAAAFMLALGLWMMPLDLWGKGYLAMGIVMLVQTTVNITKTLRDNSESEKLIRKIEDAKTEKLLVKFNRDSDS